MPVGTPCSIADSDSMESSLFGCLVGSQEASSDEEEKKKKKKKMMMMMKSVAVQHLHTYCSRLVAACGDSNTLTKRGSTKAKAYI